MLSYKQFLCESSTPLGEDLTATFGSVVVFSDSPFNDMSVDVMKQMFSILNKHLFEQKVPQDIPLWYESFEIIKTELIQRNKKNRLLKNKLHGVHSAIEIHDDDFEFQSRNDFEFDNELIALNKTLLDGNATFSYILAALCHEMIHSYDLHFGDYKDALFFSIKHNMTVNFHRTKMFKSKMKESNMNHIRVIENCDGIDFSELNDKSLKELEKLHENDISAIQQEYEQTGTIQLGSVILTKGQPICIVNID